MHLAFVGSGIRGKLLILPFLMLIGLAALQVFNLLVEEQILRKEIFPAFGNEILASEKNALKIAVDIEAAHLAEGLKNLKTTEEKIALIIAETDPVRFFEDGSGYFFTYDLTGVRINVPINKKDNGKNLIHLQDKKGNRIIEDIVKAAKSGGGFTEYYFEKEGKGIQPKLSYSKTIPGTDILIGAGVYIDNVKTETATLSAKVKVNRSGYLPYLISVFAVITLASFLACHLITRSVNRSISRIARGLSQGGEEVSTASHQIASASQALAEGASQQAASLEETSSSLEEMASMTKQNASNASHANMLVLEANKIVEKANGSMNQLKVSMDEISRASVETQKIIKTIDEIAFQTNLLALNAAIEAARAGESGAGFAVVADEVRGLAMRAAEAAKSTAGLIEGTVRRVKEGTDLVAQTDAEFREAASSVAKSGELVAEISAASQEQDQGIDQINRAVSQMDKVTQQTAANAEETASASEEMNSQATQMKSLLQELGALVGEKTERKPTKDTAPQVTSPKRQALPPRTKLKQYDRQSPAHATNGNGKGSGKPASPQLIIPFEDDTLNDF